MIQKERVRKLNSLDFCKGDIVYWMSRDQRVDDNWALLFAQELSQKNRVPIKVVFCLCKQFLGATLRQYEFMLKGLEQIEKKLKRKNIAFDLIIGSPDEQIPKYVKNEGCLVTDFDPLKIKRKWKRSILKKIKIPFYEVDAHNIVPVWTASDKQEYGAYTIRPKINKLLPQFLVEYPPLKKQKSKVVRQKINWSDVRKKLCVDKKVKEVNWIKPGEDEAKKTLKFFIKNKLGKYSTDRNNPNLDGSSNLSPYLHFGHISSQRVALNILKSKINSENFLEELIVRKELSDNFCYYNKNYDNPKGFPPWALDTLKKHEKDKRIYIYSKKELENAKTHDNLWNAAQMQMVKSGKMHGFLRMYWAKKILEWTKTPKIAQKIAIYLNDKYELDGRDPNGYTGIAWSIGALHDRAWKEIPVFGKIRYMSYSGCKTKFDVDKYILNVIKNLTNEHVDSKK